jgi:hypothetical protein
MLSSPYHLAHLLLCGPTDLAGVVPNFQQGSRRHRSFQRHRRLAHVIGRQIASGRRTLRAKERRVTDSSSPANDANLVASSPRNRRIQGNEEAPIGH